MSMLKAAIRSTHAIAIAFAPPVPASAASQVACSDHDVVLTGLGVQASLAGTLCSPGGKRPATVMVLVPGATYNRAYWDFPYRLEHYNFRATMNAASYATFVVDLLGTGRSSHPPSGIVTSSVQARVVHEAVQGIRQGKFGTTFDSVVLAGHSLGSAVAVLEAGTYDDIDALLLTGFSHHMNPDVWQAVGRALHPAADDPGFARQGGLDPGYLTTKPGTRDELFYAEPTTDTALLAQDEATKDAVAGGAVPDALATVLTPYSAGIRAPVLLVNGDRDAEFCLPDLGNCATATALRTSEAPYFTGSPSVRTYLLPGAGHSINLATNVAEYKRIVRSWLFDVAPERLRDRLH